MKQWLQLILLVSLLNSSNAYAQWKKLYQFPAQYIQTIFFLENSPVGFVTTLDRNQPNKGNIYRTDDNGLTWNPCQLELPFQDCWSITFKDSLTGWFSTDNDGVNYPQKLYRFIYKTTDGGVSWHLLDYTNAQRINSVYYHTPSKRLFANCSQRRLVAISEDDGSTFREVPTVSPPMNWSYSFAFSNDSMGVVGASFRNAPGDDIVLYTKDTGNTWNRSNLSPGVDRTNRLLGIRGTSSFFYVTEYESEYLRPDTVFRSVDGGAYWTVRHIFPPEITTTGDIQGSSENDLYLQTNRGFYQSIDSGGSWRYICGPGYPFQGFTPVPFPKFHFDNNRIFAADHTAGLWYCDLTQFKQPIASPSSIDFGTTSLCEERDSVVTLRNTGCDTLRVSGVDVQGVGFSSNVATEIIIPPGDSATVPIITTVDTSQGNTSTGIIIFSSDGIQIPSIPLLRSYTYPKTYSFHIAMVDATATSGEIVRLAIVGEQGLGSIGSGVNRLDFDLSLNEDLLEYIRPEGNNTVSKNGSRITISNLNELTSNTDTLVILVYHVFLTKDSATDITVSNISINNGDTSICAPKIAAITQAGFTYRYECGDRHIQSFLRTGQASLEITSIRPNPTSASIIVAYRSLTNERAQIQIIDDLGKVVLEETVSMSLGDNIYTVSIPKHLSGVFYARMQSQGIVATERFIKY